MDKTMTDSSRWYLTSISFILALIWRLIFRLFLGFPMTERAIAMSVQYLVFDRSCAFVAQTFQILSTVSPGPEPRIVLFRISCISDEKPYHLGWDRLLYHENSYWENEQISSANLNCNSEKHLVTKLVDVRFSKTMRREVDKLLIYDLI